MDPSTTTTTNGLSVSLRAWPISKSDEQNLTSLIARLSKEKRSFRGLSEQGLEAELRAVGSEEVPESNFEPAEDEASGPQKTRKDEVSAARAEILSHVAEAQSDASKALDVISLVLSKHTPKQAELSISPIIKQSIPMGSLGVEVSRLPQKTESKSKDDGLVSTGWRLQSLNATANSLLASATRLEMEIEQEAKHWEQVLSIQAKGWSICRLPQERQTLGVCYGFAEAAPEFRNKGLRGLRRNDEGNLYLDLGPNVPKSCALRVRVMQHKRVVASSLDANALDTEDDSIGNSILQARNALYIDELYYEMYREARTMTNRGVRCMTDSIILPMENEKLLIIDLVPIGQVEPEDKEAGVPLAPQAPTPQSLDRDLSKSLALASKILLSHAHRRKYNRRTTLPPPLTESKSPRPIYSIVRPLLALLQQQSALSQLESLLNDVQANYRLAGIDLTIDSPNGVLDLVAMLDSAPTADRPLVEIIASTISGPLQAQITITLPSTSSLQVHLRTHLQGPEYRILIFAPPTSSLSYLPREVDLGSAAETEDHVLHLLMCDLVSVVAAQNKRWQITSLHEGQLTTEPGLDGTFQLLSVVVERRRLEISCRGASKDSEITVNNVEWTPETTNGPKFWDEVRSIGAEEVG